jgi:tetratricopeptide (TPR) repeat protein
MTRRPKLAIALALSVATAITFAPVLWNGFIDLDDQTILVDNPWIRGFGRANLGWMLTTFHSGHSQPLSWLTLALDYRLWGLNAGGYHLTSLLLHAANAALVFLLAARLLARAGVEEAAATAGAAVAALLWALHPLRVEPVAWATARRDVLSAFFTLLAFLAYTRPPGTPGRLTAALTAAVLAVLSKTSAMVIPAFLIVLDVYPLGRLGGERGWTGPAARRVWIEKLPFLAVALLAAVVAAVAARSSGALRPLGEITVARRVGAVMYGLGFYLWKTIVPAHLLPLYEYPLDMGPAQRLAVAGLATGILVAAAALALRRRCPGFAAAFAVYLAAIAPTLGAAQAGPQIAADRYTYLAALGWSVLAGGLLVAGARRLAPRLLATTPIVIVLAFLTAMQAATWRDPRTLWGRVVAIEPTHAFALKSLGDAARLDGDIDGAIAWYGRSIAIRLYPDAETNLAALLAQRGRVDEAIAHYRAAIRADPGYAFAYTSYGVLLANSGRTDEAIAAHRQALAVSPGLMEAHANLANVLQTIGRSDEAMREYEEALRLRPSAEVYSNIGLMLLNANRPADAVAMFRRALALRTDIPVLHQNLARALKAVRRLDPNTPSALE